MFSNYFRIVWRNLVKERQFTILNLAGLSTGLCCALLIWLWISDEMNIDKYNEKDGQLYQVMQNLHHQEGIETLEHTSGLLADALAAEIPEVERAATVVPASWFSNKGIISSGETRIKAGAQFISKEYLNMFTIRFIEGAGSALLPDKRSVLISDELATKLFHTTQHVVGKTVEWSDGEFAGSYLITGIFKKNPPTASDKFDMLFNFDLFSEARPSILKWDNSDPNTYLILKPGTDIARFNKKIAHFMDSKVKEKGRELFVRKFSDEYLYGQYTNGVQSGGRIAYIKLFSVIGVFILIIACINFMNLSTAKASKRAKEVGIKKVIGASRSTLVFQYLGESVLMSLLALIIALVLISTLLPAFNSITGKELALNWNSNLLFYALLITIVTGIIAGSYPALYLSSFKPAPILKGALKTSFGELLARKGLVVFQFSLSVTAIIAVLIIYRQTNFIQSKNLGYNRDNVINFTIPLERDSASMALSASFINELKNVPGVVSAGSYYHNLNGEHGSISDFQWPGKDPQQEINFANLEVGQGFIETVGIKIKEGRGFSDINALQEIIFNETAIRQMGLKDPVGKRITFWGREKLIVGVAADFNFESLYQKVTPCFFQQYPVMPNVVARINNVNQKETIARMEELYSKFNKGLSFDYRFLDDSYQALYVSENRVAALSKYFAGLAIIISCLGLFGLAAFTAQKRQKEIGIRKVIGASVRNIAFMLSADFLRLVLIAAVIAFPVSWWVMSNWLNGFAYRIPLNADVFLIAGSSILVITLLTISFQTIKAALVNPAKNLRTE
jgi:putative ABC transport system permease protein